MVDRADVEARVLGEFPWLASEDLTHLLDDCTDSERELIIASYVTSNVNAPIPVWERIVVVLGSCASIAEAVSGISGAMSTVKAMLT